MNNLFRKLLILIFLLCNVTSLNAQILNVFVKRTTKIAS